jgi:hypothetical protein
LLSPSVNAALSSCRALSSLERHAELHPQAGQLYIKGRLDEDTYEAERQRLEARLAAAPPPVVAQTLDYRAAFDRLARWRVWWTGRNWASNGRCCAWFFDRIWIERQVVVAITPSPLYLPLVATARAVLNMVGREGFEPSTS